MSDSAKLTVELEGLETIKKIIEENQSFKAKMIKAFEEIQEKIEAIDREVKTKLDSFNPMLLGIGAGLTQALHIMARHLAPEEYQEAMNDEEAQQARKDLEDLLNVRLFD